MSCKLAALRFQVNVNYGTWSIDVGTNNIFCQLYLIVLVDFGSKSLIQVVPDGQLQILIDICTLEILNAAHLTPFFDNTVSI